MSARAAAVAAAMPVLRVVVKHHALVRLSHWLNVPLLLGLIASGLSIYWASPVFEHEANPVTRSTDYVADIGIWVVRHVPGAGPSKDPGGFVYERLGLGTFRLSQALRLHWLFAYLFMLNGLLYLVGLGLGGGYRALLPRRTDLRDAARMQIYYLGLPVAKLLRRPWPHPHVTTKYNALQRGAYVAMPVLGLLSVLTGWAMHKPVQLWWLAALFGGYDWARLWHFWLLWVFLLFVIPHVLLVFADGWDTFRSMVVGWSTRVPEAPSANSPARNTTSTPPV